MKVYLEVRGGKWSYLLLRCAMCGAAMRADEDGLFTHPDSITHFGWFKPSKEPVNCRHIGESLRPLIDFPTVQKEPE